MSDDRIKIAYGSFYGGLRGRTLPSWDNLPDWIRDAMRVSYFQGLLDKPSKIDNSAHIKRLEAALLSISKNTCCDNCREAANVARAALASYVGLAEELGEENDVNDAYARGEHVLGVTK